MGDVLRTAAVSAERRIRDFYAAIMAELRAESPEFAARVAARIEALNAQTGLASGLGR